MKAGELVNVTVCVTMMGGRDDGSMEGKRLCSMHGLASTRETERGRRRHGRGRRWDSWERTFWLETGVAQLCVQPAVGLVRLDWFV